MSKTISIVRGRVATLALGATILVAGAVACGGGDDNGASTGDSDSGAGGPDGTVGSNADANGSADDTGTTGNDANSPAEGGLDAEDSGTDSGKHTDAGKDLDAGADAAKAHHDGGKVADSGEPVDASKPDTSTAPTGDAGAVVAGHESWVWLFTNFAQSLTAIAAHPATFTHVSPTFYTLNYKYASGVAYYSNCPNSGANYVCTAPGTDVWDSNLTSAGIAQQVNAMGLKIVPAIYAGGDNGGIDDGIDAILNDATVQSSFITSMTAEAVTKGYAGYNLDFELSSTTNDSYADKFVSFVNAFKAALSPHGTSLSLDIITANINDTGCSGNNGFVDLAKLQSSDLDRIILEAYIPTLGGPSSACVKQTASPIPCANDVVGLLNIMCTFVTSDKLVMGVDSLPGDSNPIAGAEISTLQSYGVDKIAVWPDYNSDGTGGGYAFMDAKGIVPANTTWFALLNGFLTTP